LHALYIKQNDANDKQKRHRIIEEFNKFFTCGEVSQVLSKQSPKDDTR